MQRKEKGKAEEKLPEGYLHSLITSHWMLHSVTCLVPVRGRFVTLLKVKNHLLKDEKNAGLEVTRFWPKLLGLESCSEEADCFQAERV